MIYVNRSELPPILKELDFLHARLDPRVFNQEDFGAFNRSLRLCTEGFGTSLDKNHQAQLATHWLNRFEHLLSHASKRTLTFPAYQMQTLASIILNNGFLHEAVANDKHARILANLIIRRVNLRDEFDLVEEHGPIENLLQQWGKEPPEGVLQRTPNVVDFIYGKGVWDLYAPDANPNANLAQHFWDIGLPVQGQINQSNKKLIDTPNIPQDML